MIDLLFIVSSTDGHTFKICEEMKDQLNESLEAQIIPIEDAPELNINNHKKVVIGASIRYGKHNKKLFDYIDQNLHFLNSGEHAFFTVNVVARKPEKNEPETNPYMQKFLKITNWKPAKLGVFAGKINYSQYGFFDRHIIRFIMWIGKGPTDLRGEFEFTNWDKVKLFSKTL